MILFSYCLQGKAFMHGSAVNAPLTGECGDPMW
jgi:hypothetical protein